ncbi:hypothetical protein ACET3Z_005442 [Daucus carota]
MKMKTKKKTSKAEGCSKHTLSSIKKLGIELLSSTTHINNLPVLISIINDPSSPPHFVLESLLSLQSFFTPLLPKIPSSSSSSKKSPARDSDAHVIYFTWLRAKFDQLAQSLIDLSVSDTCQLDLREVVLDTIMEFVKVGNGGNFHSLIYHKFLRAMVDSTSGIDVLLDLLRSKYFKYIDVRYFTYISLEKLGRNLEKMKVSDNKSQADDSKNSMVHSFYNIHRLLSCIPIPEGLEKTPAEFEMWDGSGIFNKEVDNEKHAEVLKAKNKKQNQDDGDKKSFTSDNVPATTYVAKKIKLKFTKVWMCFLSLPLPLDVYKEVLVTLHQDVIPYLSNPILLCDFLTRSYDIGGVISVMALSSLYILITQHGLEYPNFYEKLYVLLEPSIFMAKHRGKFFQLLDSCLKSPLLPAYLAAAFAKKLSRLSLSVPPSGGLIIVALIHNLLRRHPSINCLVHREDVTVTVHDDPSERNEEVSDHVKASSASKDMSSIKSGFDHFNDEETDPKKTNSMRSSLWEIDTLRHHYCPPVSRFVLSLENDLTVRAKTAEVAIKDFSSGSYATIFDDEIRRRVKQVPLAFYKTTPNSLFSESDFGGWTFNLKDDNMNDDKESDHIPAKRQRMEGA